MGEDIGVLVKKAVDFQARLDRVKAQLGKVGFDWYPYDSLGSFALLDPLLTGERRDLAGLAGDGLVLDVGCGDGHLAFFLESLGCRVRAVDYPATNYNRMRGVRALKQALGSSVEIHEIDADSYFALPDARYSVVFLFGLLYHLKNPYYVMETLARHARYCFLSTRVARYTPDRRQSLAGLPVAYLVRGDETNQDATNYWIFSETGLHRLFDRTHWQVCEYMAIGNLADSEPSAWQGDERAFCLLERRVVDRVTRARYLAGWHLPEEEGSWRWTERRFALEFPAPPSGRCAELRLEFTLPDRVLDRLGTVTLQAAVNGAVLCTRTYSTAGEHRLQAAVPAELLTREAALVEFALDRALPPGDQDCRELGVVVSRVELE